MTALSPITAEMADLLELLCLDELSPVEADRLEELIRADEDSCRHYIIFMHMHALAERFAGADPQREAKLLEIRLLHQPHTSPSLPSATSSPVLGFLAGSVHDTVGYISSGWPAAYLIATVIFAVALLIGSLTPVSQPALIARQSSVPGPSVVEPRIESVGRITGIVDCRFDQRSEISDPKAQDPRPKTLVSLGDKFALTSGLMEITYDTGAKVILQGPVTYEVESKDGGYLSVGKLTARLEEKAAESNPQSPIPNPSLSTTHYPLFTIKTPTAIVTDLGTEFAVEVSERGGDRVCVFQGKVMVRTSKGRASQELALTEGQSSLVDAQGTITPRPAEKVATLAAPFVRHIPRHKTPTVVSLADLVAGGNGFSNRSDWGIDPQDAHVVVQHFGTDVVTSGKYERYSGVPQVDGVFIPNGANGPVQVDSAGHTFALPKTCGRSCGPIWVTKGSLWIGPPAKPRSVVRLHANVGITFNLAAIRASAGRELARFQSTVARWPQAEHFEHNGGADVWVLVDGQMRFGRTNLHGADGLLPIDVPLESTNKFLTLIATEGVDGIASDHVQHLDPRIVLKTEPSSEAASQEGR